MNKETITEYKDQAESRCRELFDQLQTLQAQASQVEVELERSRGDFRTYSKLLNEWPENGTDGDPVPPLVPSVFMPPMFPEKESELNSKPNENKTKKKEETHA